MAYSNQTSNYGLPLPLGTDKSNFMDTNTAFQAVDTALKGAVDGVAALSGTTGGISEALTGLTNRVDGIDTDITILKNVDGTIVGNFGTVETGQVSAHEYAAGDMFVWLNVIRKATVTIHVGDQFVNGTNCVIVSLDDVIGNLNVINDLGSISEALSVNHWTKVAEITGDGTSTWGSILNSIVSVVSPYISEDYEMFLDEVPLDGFIERSRGDRIRPDLNRIIFTGIRAFDSNYMISKIEFRPGQSTWNFIRTTYNTGEISIIDYTNEISTAGYTIQIFARKL